MEARHPTAWTGWQREALARRILVEGRPLTGVLALTRHATICLALSLLALAALLAGCGRTDGAATGGNGVEQPAVLRLAFTSTSEEEVELRTVAYRELAEYLRVKVGVPVEVIRGADFSAALAAMRAGKLDIVAASPLPYIVARAKFGAEPLVTPAREDGTASSYYAVFIARPDRGLRTIEDVKARARELVLAFADPVSTSGHLIPRAHLEAMGVNPETDFKKLIFSGSHIASVMNVKSGKVDVATVTKTFFDRMVRDGRVKAGEVDVIWTSPPIQQSIVFTRPGIPPDIRGRLEAAYCSLHEERPDIWAGLRIFSGSEAVRYVPIKDSAFDEYRQIARRLENVKLLD